MQNDKFDKLLKLNELKEKGALTQDEFKKSAQKTLVHLMSGGRVAFKSSLKT
jgi:hypothetical protein